MLVAQDNYLIQIDNSVNSTLNIKGINGELISIDCDYQKHKHACRTGTVFACPISISGKYLNDTEIKTGDTVVIHHFVTMPDHLMPFKGGNIYRAEYFHIYAKIEDNKIIPIEDVLFVEPITEPEENLFMGTIQVKSQRELLPQQGKVFALSKKAKQSGLMEGDHVFFTANADYSMKIIGMDLWRMRLRNITLIIRDGKPVCLSDKILMKELHKKEDKQLFCKKTQQLDGEIVEVGKNVKGVSSGAPANFYPSIGGSVNYNNEIYTYVEPRHINYLT